ncbi:MAG: YARHG domain-containing protein [Reichenbachiella sp.]|uniref:YARHG domain-containing protein n=1 Tax=Reichenbachiella sp. TaxID=2184521 RepID=UPI0029676DED|nr:YARHG domain-containing protein [Reichenbachiella sp.]MDW3209248.1 YARHG domain-containing protein [Reichenbachiella sp.]
MRKYVVLFLFLIVTTTINAQETILYGIDDLEKNKFSPWEFNGPTDIVGSYGFGWSEWEWGLIVLKAGENWCIQTEASSWDVNELGEAIGILTDFKTYNELTLKGNELIDEMGNSIVSFNVYDNSSKIYNLTDEEDLLYGAIHVRHNKVEFGTYHEYVNKLGNYGMLSTRVFDRSELAAFSAYELKIMRNEIFARYGYIFREGGEMAEYFKMKRWYKGTSNNVDKNLTCVEMENIKTILALEKELKNRN